MNKENMSSGRSTPKAISKNEATFITGKIVRKERPYYTPQQIKDLFEHLSPRIQLICRLSLIASLR